MVPVPLTALQPSRSEQVEHWPWLGQAVLQPSRSKQVCMTCHFFRHHAAADCIPQLACHLHLALTAAIKRMFQGCFWCRTERCALPTPSSNAAPTSSASSPTTTRSPGWWAASCWSNRRNGRSSAAVSSWINGAEQPASMQSSATSEPMPNAPAAAGAGTGDRGQQRRSHCGAHTLRL